MTAPDHIMPPPLRDAGPLETMARAFHNADAQHFAIAYAGPIPDYYTERAQAAITALTEAGFAIVPVEPTPEMAKVGVHVAQTGAVLGAWEAMIKLALAKEGE